MENRHNHYPITRISCVTEPREGTHISSIRAKICKLSLRVSSLIILTMTLGALLSHSVTDVIAQTPKSIIQDQNFMSLDVADAAYNANTSKFLGSKNITFTPYQITEEHYIENGFLKSVGNITNNQTFTNTHLSDTLLLGKGNGTFETSDGQKITWISSDLGRFIDNHWVFYGMMLFNNTHTNSLSILNNTIGLSRSTAGLNEPEYIWLLKK